MQNHHIQDHQVSDHQLLHEFVAGHSEAAFATIVSRYSDLVYSTCLREVSNVELAQDVTQVVFLLLTKKAASFREGVVLAGWLFKTARFACQDAMKQEIRRLRREEKAAEEMMRDTQLENRGLDWSEVEPELHRALGTLSSDDRNAVLLRFFQDKSFKVTGETLGISEDAARMKVSRAVEKMRRHFKKRGFALSLAALTTYLSAEATIAAPAVCVGAAVALGKVVTTQMSAEAIGSSLISSAVNAKVPVLFAGVWRALMWSQAKTVTAVVIGTTVAGIGASQVVRHVAVPENASSVVGNSQVRVAHSLEPETQVASRGNTRPTSRRVKAQPPSLQPKELQPWLQPKELRQRTPSISASSDAGSQIPTTAATLPRVNPTDSKTDSKIEPESQVPQEDAKKETAKGSVTRSPQGTFEQNAISQRLAERGPHLPPHARSIELAPRNPPSDQVNKGRQMGESKSSLGKTVGLRGSDTAAKGKSRGGATQTEASAAAKGKNRGEATQTEASAAAKGKNRGRATQAEASLRRVASVPGHPVQSSGRPIALPIRPNPGQPNIAAVKPPNQIGSQGNRSQLRSAAQERAKALGNARQTYVKTLNGSGDVRNNALTPTQRDGRQSALKKRDEASAAADKNYAQAVGKIMGRPSR